MSVQAMGRVMDDSEAKGVARLVLLIMANRAGGDGDMCFASVERIAHECRVHTRTVQRSIRSLEASGDLTDMGVHPRFKTVVYGVMPTGVAQRHPGTPGPILPPKRKKQGLGVVVDSTDLDSDLELKAGKPATDTNPNQPTHDQLDLARKLTAAWGQELTPAAVVKLNQTHGRGHVEDAMRSLRGFPPEEAVRKLYAYVDKIAEDNALGAAG
jgi:hypothetical protein